MTPLIRAAEIWLPDAEGTLLEFGAGLYPGAPEFGAISRGMCFGRAEGLPGRAWDEARPLLLTDLQSGHFRRAAAAQRAGLSCAVALPCYADDRLLAVVLLFCGGLAPDTGAVELWRNDPRISTDMTLDDGYYGATAPAFAAAARETYMPRGTGLPGLAWQRQATVWADGLDNAPQFLRGEAAAAAGIRRGLALPCPVPGHRHHVLALLGSDATPVARRIECWEPAATTITGTGLQRRAGHCALLGPLPCGSACTSSGGDDDSLAAAFASAMPRIRQRAADEPGAVGAAAAAAGLGGLLALPVLNDGVVSEVLALYV